MHGDISWFDIQTRACKAIGDVAFHLRADVMSVFKTYFNRQRNRGFDKNFSSDAAHLDFVAAKHAFCVDGGPPYAATSFGDITSVSSIAFWYANLLLRHARNTPSMMAAIESPLPSQR